MKIIKILQRRVLCVCEIQAALGLAQSTTSKHLKILEDTGLINYTEDGLWVNYELEKTPSNPYAAILLKQVCDWMEDEADVSELVARLPRIRREDICGN